MLRNFSSWDGMQDSNTSTKTNKNNPPTPLQGSAREAVFILLSWLHQRFHTPQTPQRPPAPGFIHPKPLPHPPQTLNSVDIVSIIITVMILMTMKCPLLNFRTPSVTSHLIQNKLSPHTCSPTDPTDAKKTRSALHEMRYGHSV